jgi:hypothetical protein
LERTIGKKQAIEKKQAIDQDALEPFTPILEIGGVYAAVGVLKLLVLV